MLILRPPSFRPSLLLHARLRSCRSRPPLLRGSEHSLSRFGRFSARLRQSETENVPAMQMQRVMIAERVQKLLSTQSFRRCVQNTLQFRSAQRRRRGSLRARERSCRCRSEGAQNKPSWRLPNVLLQYLKRDNRLHSKKTDIDSISCMEIIKTKGQIHYEQC
jgi:hypothetical protein